MNVLHERPPFLIIVWVHAHYQMASGKEDPAEWFDIGRTAGYVLRKGI